MNAKNKKYNEQNIKKNQTNKHEQLRDNNNNNDVLCQVIHIFKCRKQYRLVGVTEYISYGNDFWNSKEIERMFVLQSEENEQYNKSFPHRGSLQSKFAHIDTDHEHTDDNDKEETIPHFANSQLSNKTNPENNRKRSLDVANAGNNNNNVININTQNIIRPQKKIKIETMNLIDINNNNNNKNNRVSNDNQSQTQNHRIDRYNNINCNLSTRNQSSLNRNHNISIQQIQADLQRTIVEEKCKQLENQVF